MKILFITAEGFDTPNPNNQMAEVMIRDFLEHGYSVHLVQSHRKGINPDIPESLIKFDHFSCDTVIRTPVEKTDFVRRYINDLKYAFQAKRYWIKVKDVDIIYLQSNPTILYPMILLKLFKRRIPIVYSIYDVFPGHAYDIGVIKSKLIFNILRLMQKPCYGMASAITVLGEDMKDRVVEEGAKPDRVHVVPAWFDINTVKEVQEYENKFIRKYNIAMDKFIVQFAGTIGSVFNYQTVIELAKRIEPRKDIVIHIVGDGSAKDRFIHEAEVLKLSNIQFYPLQSIDLVPDVYSACNVCIIPLKRRVIGNGIPSKVPILMACKRVIVNSVDGDSNYKRMFIEHDMGVAVDVDSYDELASSIIDLRDHPETIQRMAHNAYEYGRSNYSSILITTKLRNIFEVLIVQ